MKTNTNIKRRVKHSIKHRAQRKYKTHKNKHTKTQLKQYKTHRGGAGFSSNPNTPHILNIGDPSGSSETDIDYSGTDDGGHYGFICNDIFNINKIKKDSINEINLEELLKSTESSKINNYNRDHLLALFMTLAISIETKQHCMLNLIELDNQYYNRLMDNITYNIRIEGMQQNKKKFNKLIEDVIERNVYTPFNGAEKDIKINNLKDWVKVIEMLFGFETQYKLFLTPANLTPKQKQTILQNLKEHCAKQDENEKNKCKDINLLNPCCNINKENEENKDNKENKDNNVANTDIIAKIVDELKKLNKLPGIYTTTPKNTADIRHINMRKRQFVAANMYKWLTSNDDLENKCKLYINSRHYQLIYKT